MVKTRDINSVHFPADGKIDFLRDVQPIFANKCYECHGPTKRGGALRHALHRIRPQSPAPIAFPVRYDPEQQREQRGDLVLRVVRPATAP